MTPLSVFLDDPLVRDLMAACDEDRFAGVDFETAMRFVLTDGVLPASGLPTQSFIDIEDWLRRRGQPRSVTFSATELKNRTGDVLREVLRGRTVVIQRHAKPIAVMIPHFQHFQEK